MIEWLSGLPKTLMVTLLIGAGIFLIIMLNPPYTVCDSQLEVFKQNQIGFLYLDPKEKMIKTTEREILVNSCKQANSPGGCFKLFMKTKQLLTDLDHVPQDCSATVTGLSEVKKALWEQLKLMTELAWGQKPPTSFYEKLNWFDPADLALYCQLKTYLTNFYGEDEVVQFREKLFQALPGATGLSRNQAWDMMLMSVNCNRYL